MQYVLEDAQVSLVLSSSEYTAQMAELAHRVGAQHHNCDAQVQAERVGTTGACALTCHKPMQFASCMQRSSAEHTDMTSSVSEAMSRVKADDGALIIYTSGTTGPPKGDYERKACRQFRDVYSIVCDACIPTSCSQLGNSNAARQVHCTPTGA